MSFFIQAADGKFYDTPQLNGVDWFTDLDDDVLVTIRRFKNTTPESAKVRASKVLREAGFTFKKLEYRDRMDRRFPPDFKVLEASTFFFDIAGPIPVPMTFHSCVEEVGHVWDHQILGFESMIPPEDLMKCVIGGDISPMILRALLNEPVYKKQQERVRADINKKLYKQFPWLREITKLNWEAAARERQDNVRLQWRDT